MCSRKRDSDNGITGDYQYRALHYGPVSQRLWHREKLLLMERFLQTRRFKKICDVGCGSGIVTYHVAKLCPDAEVVGVDANSESIRFAQSRYGDCKNLMFYNYNLLDSGATELGTFDFIYATEVIEHLSKEDIHEFLKTLGQIGDRRAQYMVTTPDYGSWWPILERILDITAFVPKLRGHQHLSPFTKERLTQALASAAFRVVRMYNFCGWAPFGAHLSLSLSQRWQEREHARGKGFLICCEFVSSEGICDE